MLHEEYSLAFIKYLFLIKTTAVVLQLRIYFINTIDIILRLELIASSSEDKGMKLLFIDELYKTIIQKVA